MTKLLKIQYLLHLKFFKIQITLIKSYSSKAFQKHQECAQILPIDFHFDLNEFIVKILFNIQ
jgi:hypothetical protein